MSLPTFSSCSTSHSKISTDEQLANMPKSICFSANLTCECIPWGHPVDRTGQSNQHQECRDLSQRRPCTAGYLNPTINSQCSPSRTSKFNQVLKYLNLRCNTERRWLSVLSAFASRGWTYRRGRCSSTTRGGTSQTYKRRRTPSLSCSCSSSGR